MKKKKEKARFVAAKRGEKRHRGYSGKSPKKKKGGAPERQTGKVERSVGKFERGVKMRAGKKEKDGVNEISRFVKTTRKGQQKAWGGSIRVGNRKRRGGGRGSSARTKRSTGTCGAETKTRRCGKHRGGGVKGSQADAARKELRPKRARDQRTASIQILVPWQNARGKTRAKREKLENNRLGGSTRIYETLGKKNWGRDEEKGVRIKKNGPRRGNKAEVADLICCTNLKNVQPMGWPIAKKKKGHGANKKKKAGGENKC